MTLIKDDFYQILLKKSFRLNNTYENNEDNEDIFNKSNNFMTLLIIFCDNNNINLIDNFEEQIEIFILFNKLVYKQKFVEFIYRNYNELIDFFVYFKFDFCNEDFEHYYNINESNFEITNFIINDYINV